MRVALHGVSDVSIVNKICLASCYIVLIYYAFNIHVIHLARTKTTLKIHLNEQKVTCNLIRRWKRSLQHRKLKMWLKFEVKLKLLTAYRVHFLTTDYSNTGSKYQNLKSVKSISDKFVLVFVLLSKAF